jgi:hypothetical protein
VLRGNFHAFDEDAQVLLAEHWARWQTNFEGTERTIAGILEFIGNAKMDASRRSSGDENLRLPIGKLKARAKGMDAARREKCPRAQDSADKYSRPYFRKQDEMILPGRRWLVKIC